MGRPVVAMPVADHEQGVGSFNNLGEDVHGFLAEYCPFPHQFIQSAFIWLSNQASQLLGGQFVQNQQEVIRKVMAGQISKHLLIESDGLSNSDVITLMIINELHEQFFALGVGSFVERADVVDLFDWLWYNVYIGVRHLK